VVMVMKMVVVVAHQGWIPTFEPAL
jgi:hypothetical protein